MEFANHGAWKHCEAHLCHQLDFLPFQCKECSGTFCREHQAWKDHNCAVGLRKLQGRVVKTCTKCNSTVDRLDGLTIEESLEKHQADSNACHPETKKKKKRKKKKRFQCGLRGCKETTRFSYMQYHCKGCHTKYCMKHRGAEDHSCAERKADHYSALAKDRRASLRNHSKSESGPGVPKRGPPAVSAY